MSREEKTGLSAYLIVTACYWAFTLTDGALRMLVTGHFHALGYSPISLASLFFLYEFFGMLTNLLAGWLGARTGLRFTLLVGLSMQVVALLALSGLRASWSTGAQVTFVLAAQGLSGIAKDFTKMSAKSAIKLLAPGDASGTLFRWVAVLTGSKNTLKGFGFFLGGALLAWLGFSRALWLMALCLGATIGLCALQLPATLGRAKAPPSLRDALRCGRNIKVLSAARLLLFGARDVWFVVGLPVFLVDALGWTFVHVGAYLAGWIILYGGVQAAAPMLLRNQSAELSVGIRTTRNTALGLALVAALITAALHLGSPAEATILLGLGVFGVLFALSSAVHSYLILAFAADDRVSTQVGYYYMANAGGRLLGTVLSGLAYQRGGLTACLLVAAGMLALSAVIASALRADPVTS